MIDYDKIKEALEIYKGKSSSSNLERHEIWIPDPERDEAKLKGAKWNHENKRWEFASNSPSDHFCSRFLPKNFHELSARVPFELKDVLREAGVVTTKVNGEWKSYVMGDEKYIPLIELLKEYELL